MSSATSFYVNRSYAYIEQAQKSSRQTERHITRTLPENKQDLISKVCGQALTLLGYGAVSLAWYVAVTARRN